MKLKNAVSITIFGLLISGFGSTQVRAGTPSFVEIQSDKTVYILNDKAVLTAYIKTQPTNPNDEIFLSSTLDSAAIKNTRISNDEAASVTPPLTTGAHVYEVDVYLEDRNSTQPLYETIAFYNEEVCQLQKQLAATTDPTQQTALQSMITRDQGLIAQATAELQALRRLVETDTLNLTVTASLFALSGVFASPTPAPTDVLLISDDQNGGPYTVGAQATFTTHVLTTFTGSSGPEEILIRTTLDAAALGVVLVSVGIYQSQSTVFATANIGSHTFKSNLLIRPKAQADSLRDGISKANILRTKDITLRDQTTDPQKKAFYQSEIDDLTLLTNNFYNQLETLLVLVQAKNFYITVTN